MKSLKQIIEQEKNIAIRERHEKTIQRNYTIMLILFLGGGYLIGRQFLDFLTGSIIAALFLIIYIMLEDVQEKYAKYTDELIRKEGKKRKK